jgi:LmeA-like phospholipid-binding
VTEPTVPMEYPGWEPPAQEQEQPPRVKRRRRRGTKWLIALVVLLGLLVGADRIALVVAEDQLASHIQSSQHLSQKPDVSIDGFPFLTQVIARDFPHATVDIHGLVANGLTISDLHADLRGVHVNSGFNGATVDTLTATAELSYADIGTALSSQLNVQGIQVGTVQVAEAGPDQITASYSLLGVSISATIGVTLSAANTLEFRSISFHTPLSGIGVSPQNFDLKYDLGSLPFGIDLTQLDFTSSGVEIFATGSHVNLSQSSVSSG